MWLVHIWCGQNENRVSRWFLYYKLLKIYVRTTGNKIIILATSTCRTVDTLTVGWNFPRTLLPVEFRLLFSRYKRLREPDDCVPHHRILQRTRNEVGRVKIADPLDERLPVTTQRSTADENVVGTVLLTDAWSGKSTMRTPGRIRTAIRYKYRLKPPCASAY